MFPSLFEKYANREIGGRWSGNGEPEIICIYIYVYTCVCMCVSVRMEELRGLQRHLRSFDGMKVLENIKHVYIVRVIIHLFIFINSRRQRR